MQVLLLHPDDGALAGPWIGHRWDAVFDLARSGWAACERWARVFGCPVRPIDALREDGSQIRRVRELLQLGTGRLVDQAGLDWWELTAILIHQQLESLVLLRKFVDGLPPEAEVSITRDGFEAQALRFWLGKRLRVISSPAAPPEKGLRHYADRLSRLPGAQVLEILGDKYDTGYRLRRHWHRRALRSSRPVVLLPSTYVNVSLMGIAYARLLPDAGFLLVSTRRSGRLREVPHNVQQAWLASYASGAGSDKERRDILERWEQLKKEIETIPELAMFARLGLMNDFPRRFADGLAIRDAWQRLLETEPVRAVLCGDDSNPYTHIPLLLAARRSLPTIVCHHGGLDGRYLIKTNHADVILAKGRMERDYLVHTCGMDPGAIEMGAPTAPKYRGDSHLVEAGEKIVFFSEPYEMSAGRTEEIYRDILPGLVDLARQIGRRLAIKLHPSENLGDRQEMARRVLKREQMETLTWVTGPLQPDFLQTVWFGVTVLSSVALDCVLQGVPCFFCDWLDLWPYGYVAQYRKFGVGMGLRSPSDIATIPELLASWRPSRKVVEDCWQALTPERFEEILAGQSAASDAPLRMQRSQ
jgi:hypothetical protein